MNISAVPRSKTNPILDKVVIRWDSGRSVEVTDRHERLCRLGECIEQHVLSDLVPRIASGLQTMMDEAEGFHRVPM